MEEKLTAYTKEHCTDWHSVDALMQWAVAQKLDTGDVLIWLDNRTGLGEYEHKFEPGWQFKGVP